MRNNFVLLVAAFLMVASSICYLICNNKGYPYGLECTFCIKDLPFGLTPKLNSSFPQSFVLLDNDDYELVGIGFRYSANSFKIKEFLAYGYNDTSVIVKATDSLNVEHYLVSYKTGYKSKKGNHDISFKDLSNNTFEQVKEKYKWIEIDDAAVENIKRMKSLFFIGALLSFYFLLRLIFKFRNQK